MLAAAEALRLEGHAPRFFVGGSDQTEGEVDFKHMGANVVVGTPGRLEATLAHMCKLNICNILVALFHCLRIVSVVFCGRRKSNPLLCYILCLNIQHCNNKVHPL